MAYTEELIQLFETVKHNEGRGYDPDDPAGATIYGIAKIYHEEEYNKLIALINEGKENTDEFKQTLYDVYYSIYTEHQSVANLLPGPIKWQYFDFYFNAGKHANETLQKTINQLDIANLVVDGIIGPKTKGVVKKIDWTSTLISTFYSTYTVNRVDWYNEQRHKSGKFVGGWIDRVVRTHRRIIDFFGHV